MEQQEIKLSINNRKHADSIWAYGSLKENWDSYGANPPSRVALAKAISFIADELSPRRLEVFYTVPTPDGDVLVELKNKTRNLEFIFSETVGDKIIGSNDGELHNQGSLNEASLRTYLNWLYGK